MFYKIRKNGTQQMCENKHFTLLREGLNKSINKIGGILVPLK
jgi:hypothetical protein